MRTSKLITSMPDIPDIETLISDHKAFDSFVYTPVREAIIELRRRWNDPKIKVSIEIPEFAKEGFKAINYISLITSNYEIRRFINVADALDLKPLILEQTKDKFTSNNEWKHGLGQVRFFRKLNGKGEAIIESINVIDFPKYDGKYLPDVQTFWGQSLTDFHHELFLKTFPKLSGTIHDVSEWIHSFGKTPREYYPTFLTLLIKHGIQFENFMLSEKEMWFTREVFLPAFIEVYKKTGLKPLIVALEPTEIEGDKFWISHPIEDMQWLKEKMIQ